MSDVQVTEKASEFTGVDYRAAAPGSDLMPNPRRFNYWSEKLGQHVYTLAEGMVPTALWSGIFSNYFKLEKEAEDGKTMESPLEVSESDHTEENGYIALRPVSVDQWVAVTAFRPFDTERFDTELKKTWESILKMKKKRDAEDAVVETSLQSVYETYFTNLGIAGDISKAKERLTLINWDDRKDITEYKAILLAMFDMSFPQMKREREAFDWLSYPIWAQVKLTAGMLSNIRFAIGRDMTAKKNAGAVRLLQRIVPDAVAHRIEQYDDLMEFRRDLVVAFQSPRIADEVYLAFERGRLKAHEMEILDAATDPGISDAQYLASCATDYVNKLVNAYNKH